MVFGSAVLAQTTVWTGKALGYDLEQAELYVGLDGFNDLNTAIKVGEIQPNGQFSFELPESLPDEILTNPEVREDCGKVTIGLKIGVIASVLVKTQTGIAGELQHANRASAFADLSNLKTGQNTKLTAWFYANQAGKLVEDCLENNFRQIANVQFQKGWNVLTAYYLQKGENLTAIIRNGYTPGLQRWYFTKQAPEQP